MTLLLLFAFVAGAGTAISPCVLPVLPALLSAGATGGRRRPIAIVIGLATTFAITVAGFAKVVDGVGLGDGALRSISVVVLAGFGIALLAPRLTDRLEAPLSRLARFGPRSGGDGFWSGLGVGAALGFVYAPCAGPILAAVISVSAASGRSVAIAIAYSAGSAVVLFGLMLGGRRLLDHLRGPALQRVLGVVMLLTALAVATDTDVRFQTALADHFPSVLVNPTGSLERSSAVEERLAELRGNGRFTPSAHAATRGEKLPVLGRAPDFAGNERWFNSKPLTVAGLRGRVVLVDFWTYTCINCIRTLPYTRAWDAAYRDRGLTIVGVHTPEFSFERDAGNVEDAIAQNKLRYPSPRTTRTRPGTRGATSTGPRSTSSTPRAASATSTSARATTTRPRRRSAACSRRPARSGWAPTPRSGPPRRSAARRRPRPTSARPAPPAGCPGSRSPAPTPTTRRRGRCRRAASRSPGAGASTPRRRRR